MPMLAKIKQLLISVVVIILSPILIILLPIWVLIFGNKSKVSVDEVLEYLKRMEAGEIDEYWWDDFINVPIKNDELDKIRERCEKIWIPDSGFLSKESEDDEYHLNEKGIREIQSLINKCIHIKNTETASNQSLKHGTREKTRAP